MEEWNYDPILSVQDILWRSPVRRLKAIRLIRASMERKGELSESQWQWLHYAQLATYAQLT